MLGLVEKPKPEKRPSNLAVIGRYILQPEVMRILDKGETGAGGEIQLTDAMAQLIGKQPFHAIKVDAVRHDCGDKAGYVIANLALALERDDIGPADPGLSRPALGCGVAYDLLETAKLGLACKPAIAHFAELDRASDDPRIERGIVVLSSFGERSRPFDLAPDPGNQHFEVERLGDHRVGAAT